MKLVSGRLEQQEEQGEHGEQTQRVKAQGVARGLGQEGALWAEWVVLRKG